MTERRDLPPGRTLPEPKNRRWRGTPAAEGRHSGGEGLRVVAGLLGHADIKTTFGYADPAEGSVFDAAKRVSRGLSGMLDGGEAGR